MTDERRRRRLSPTWPRVTGAPFEAAIAAVIVAQAGISLGGWGAVDPVALLLPGWLPLTFNVAYLLSGVAILGGLLGRRGNVEGAGLVLLGCLVTARGVMFGTLLGWNVQSVSALVFSMAVAAACAARVWVLRSTW